MLRDLAFSPARQELIGHLMEAQSGRTILGSIVPVSALAGMQLFAKTAQAPIE